VGYYPQCTLATPDLHPCLVGPYLVGREACWLSNDRVVFGASPGASVGVLTEACAGSAPFQSEALRGKEGEGMSWLNRRNLKMGEKEEMGRRV